MTVEAAPESPYSPLTTTTHNSTWIPGSSSRPRNDDVAGSCSPSHMFSKFIARRAHQYGKRIRHDIRAFDRPPGDRGDHRPPPARLYRRHHRGLGHHDACCGSSSRSSGSSPSGSVGCFSRSCRSRRSSTTRSRSAAHPRRRSACALLGVRVIDAATGGPGADGRRPPFTRSSSTWSCRAVPARGDRHPRRPRPRRTGASVTTS